MELFFSHNSGNSARSLFALVESGVDCERVKVDPRGGDTRRADYLGINPMGKVPALVSGDFVLWESNAINWYLAQQQPSARLLPASLEGQASVMRWQHFQSAHVSPASTAIFRFKSERMKAFWKIQGDPKVADAAAAELPRYLTVLQNRLQQQLWLEQDFSVADIAYAPHFWVLRDCGHDLGAFPAVHAWLERLYARSAWQQTIAVIFG